MSYQCINCGHEVDLLRSHFVALKVVVLAATNRHESIDTALLRPGRFDRHVFVELPDAEDRLEILQIHSRKAPSTADVDIM